MQEYGVYIEPEDIKDRSKKPYVIVGWEPEMLHKIDDAIKLYKNANKNNRQKLFHLFGNLKSKLNTLSMVYAATNGVVSNNFKVIPYNLTVKEINLKQVYRKIIDSLPYFIECGKKLNKLNVVKELINKLIKYSKHHSSEEFKKILSSLNEVDSSEVNEKPRTQQASPLSKKKPTKQKPVKSEKDLKTLHKITQVFKPHENSNAPIIDKLRRIGELCSELTWNNNDDSIVRNRFGRINYAKGGCQNKIYIDFEKLAHLKLLADSNAFAKSLLSLTQNNLNTISPELSRLTRAIKTVAKHYRDDSSKISLTTPLTRTLNQIIDKLFDLYILDVIKRYTDEKQFENVDAMGFDVKRSLYHIARRVSIIGEICKHFSANFVATHPELPIRSLKQIRDLLAHHHRFTTAREDDKTVDIFKRIETEINKLYKPIASLLDQDMKKIDSADFLVDKKLDGKRKNLIDIFDKYDVLAKEENSLSVAIEQSKQSERNAKDNKGDDKPISAAKRKKKRQQQKRIQTKIERLEVVQKELLTFKNEVENTMVCPLLHSTLSDLKKHCPKGKKDKHDNSQKYLDYLTAALPEEIKLVRKWQKENTRQKRAFEVEYSLGVISSLYHDIRSFHNELAPNEVNPAVSKSIDQTIQARNKLSAHAPFLDHSNQVQDAFSRIALPAFNNIDAMRILSHHYDSINTEGEQLNGLKDLITFGDAQMRLGNHKDALNHYQDAYDLSKLYFNLSETKIDLTTWHQPMQDHPLIIQYIAITKLGVYFHRQKQFKKAAGILCELYNLFLTYDLINHYPDSIRPLVTYLASLVKMEHEDTNQVYNNLCDILNRKDDCYDDLAGLKINKAVSLTEKDYKSLEAKKILDSIDLERVTLHGYRLLASVYKCQISYETVGNQPHLIRKLFEDAEKIKSDFDEVKPQIIQQTNNLMAGLEGSIIDLTYHFAQGYATHLSNSVIHSNGDKNKNDIETLQKALRIQDKYGIETYSTHNNLALVYTALNGQFMRKTGKIIKQYLNNAIGHLKKSLESPDLDRQFRANYSLAFAYETNGQYDDALKHAARAKVLLPERTHTKQDIDEINETLKCCISHNGAQKTLQLIRSLVNESSLEAKCLLDTFSKFQLSSKIKGDINKLKRQVSKTMDQAKKSDALQSQAMLHSPIKKKSDNNNNLAGKKKPAKKL